MSTYGTEHWLAGWLDGWLGGWVDWWNRAATACRWWLKWYKGDRDDCEEKEEIVHALDGILDSVILRLRSCPTVMMMHLKGGRLKSSGSLIWIMMYAVFGIFTRYRKENQLRTWPLKSWSASNFAIVWRTAKEISMLNVGGLSCRRFVNVCVCAEYTVCKISYEYTIAVGFILRVMH